MHAFLYLYKINDAPLFILVYYIYIFIYYNVYFIAFINYQLNNVKFFILFEQNRKCHNVNFLLIITSLIYCI